ncbi:hypothetical protein F5Y15DRAFT_392436 [Xylariaceae sp. FL0016]|nr:hypothetical protein F5Y15DRAFT_392436 [Xylariaceae sp. FL0016]
MEDNNVPRFVGTVWSLTVAALIFLILRIYCKLWRGRGLWWDDHLMVAAFVFLLISASINTYTVTLGFGRHIWTVSEENQVTIGLNSILGAAFAVLATSTSKTSFAVTLYRIVTEEWMKRFLIFAIVSINVTMNLFWAFAFVKCTPMRKAWDPNLPGTCWDADKLLIYQLFAVYYSSIMDFVLALLPWKILMGMAMLRREKIGVAVAMSMAAVAGVTGIVKAVEVTHIPSLDITYDRVNLTIWTTTEPAVTIMAASIPILRMLYHELRSSHRDYFRSGSRTNKGSVGTGHGAAGDRSRRTHYGRPSHYGRNSVLIMSTAGWQESQEALQEDGAPAPTHASTNSTGILKTDEVSVESRRLSKLSRDDSFEMRPLEPAYKKYGGASLDV